MTYLPGGENGSSCMNLSKYLNTLNKRMNIFKESKFINSMKPAYPLDFQ